MRPRLIVAPTTHHVESLLRSGVSRVTTLPLLEARLARAVVPELRLASRALVRLVVREVVEASPRVRALAGLEPHELVDAVDSALGALHGAGLDAAAIARACASAPPSVRARGELLAELLAAHEAALESLRVIDERSLALRLERALVSLENGVDEALFGARVVELRDVVGLPPSRLAWIERLHTLLEREGGRVVIVTPTAHEALLVTSGLDDPRERLAARWEERFLPLVSPPEVLHRPPGGGAGELAELAARLFAERAHGDIELFDAPGALRLVAAASVSVAVEVAAAEAAAALRRGVAPERVVIALPTLDEAIVRPLRRALAALSVPAYEARGAPPSSTLPVATTLTLLRAIDGRPRKELLVDLLLGVPGLGPGRIRAARALERIVPGDLLHERGAILASLEEPDRAVVASLLALLHPEAPRTLRHGLAHLDRIAQVLGWPRAFADGGSAIVRAGDPALLEGLAADLAAWSSLVEAAFDLRRAAELARALDRPLSFTDLANELELGLEGRRTVAGHRAGAVPIARLRDRLGLDADVLVLLEAHDGALPARASSDPLLSRGFLAALRAHDARRAPLPSSLASAVDLLSAVDAIGRTQERVVVVHRAVDEEGRRQLAGALPLEIARVSTAKPEVERAFAIPLVGAARLPRDVDLFEHYRRRASGREVLHPDVVARAEAEELRVRAFARAERGEVVRSPFTGELAPLDPAIEHRLRSAFGALAAQPLSVSDAEALLACPFLVFADRVLGARAHEPVEIDGGAREAGELAHRAMLAVHRALRDEGVSLVDEAEVRTVAAREIDAVLAENPAASALQRVRRERLRDDLLALVAVDVAAMLAEGRTFVEGEVPFGRGEGWPALDLSSGEERVFVSGRIDRYDVDLAGRAVVVDYKSRVPKKLSSPEFFASRAAGSVQIALYARVVAAFHVPPPPAVTARFLAYREGRLGAPGTTSRGDASTWVRQVGDAAGGEGQGAVASELLSAARAAREGFVPARRNDRCATCAHRVACRVPRVVLELEVTE